MADLLVVANTRHGPGGHRGRRAGFDEPMHDHLADAADARGFLADHDIPCPATEPDSATLAELRLLRAHVRAIAGDSGSDAPAEVGPAARGAPRPSGVAVPAPAVPGRDVPGPAVSGSITAPASAEAVDRLFIAHPVRLAADGRLVPAEDPDTWPALVADLLPAVVELRRERARLRMCGNPLCRFLFIDRSRNASRVWCEMAICGNRVRGHRHRLRRLAS